MLLYALKYLDIEYLLNELDGIFAFSFYSNKENSIILARDRAGIKPLYIGRSKSGIIFSSQYDHVINHPYIKNNSFCEDAISTYLQFGYMIERNSGIFKNTELLTHGNYIKYSLHGFEEKSYWSFPKKTFDCTRF